MPKENPGGGPGGHPLPLEAAVRNGLLGKDEAVEVNVVDGVTLVWLLAAAAAAAKAAIPAAKK